MYFPSNFLSSNKVFHNLVDLVNCAKFYWNLQCNNKLCRQMLSLAKNNNVTGMSESNSFFRLLRHFCCKVLISSILLMLLIVTFLLSGKFLDESLKSEAFVQLPWFQKTSLMVCCCQSVCAHFSVGCICPPHCKIF